MTTVADEAEVPSDVVRVERVDRVDRVDRVRNPSLLFLGVAAVLFAVVWASERFLPHAPDPHGHAPGPFTGDALLAGWVHFDGGWYHHIATSGYDYAPGRQSSIAFFPAYPLLMRVVALATRDTLFAGVLITFACGLGATLLLHRWTARRLGPRTAWLTIALLLLFPYAWYLFGAVYADALFLVCTIGAFVLLEADHPVLAGLAAGVATATRPTGVGVAVGLLAVGLERRRVVTFPFLDDVAARGWRRARASLHWHRERARPRIDLRSLRPADAGLLLSFTGLLAWCGYLARTFDDPFAFVNVEGVPGWDQAQGPATWFKVVWFEHLHHLGDYATAGPGHRYDLTYTMGTTLQAALCIGCVLLIPLVIRRIGWPYAVLVIGSVALPTIGTKDWQGGGRYLLAAFPIFAAVADWLLDPGRAWWRRTVLIASAALLLLLTSAYARGYYLA